MKALVVDDSKAIRTIVGRMLRGLGFDVREAANGADALEVMAAENNAMSLALVDWNMPVMNGLELLKRLRKMKELSSLVVVMVTMETGMEYMTAAFEAGPNEYVMKPFTKDILVEKLEMAGAHA